jgi:hypothetical protein
MGVCWKCHRLIKLTTKGNLYAHTPAVAWGGLDVVEAAGSLEELILKAEWVEPK